MSPRPDPLVARQFGRVVLSALLLVAGSLLLVVGVRDFLLYLDSYDLAMVGTTGGLAELVAVSAVGWLLVLAGLLEAAHLVLAESRVD